jgi:tetratricopeptide (TPR) repeat protein
MIFVLCTILAASTPEVPPAIAILPPITDQQEMRGLAMAFADDLVTRLLRHSEFDPANGVRTYPVSVFGWREALSAARAVGVDAQAAVNESQARQIMRRLGAAGVFSGVFWVKTKAVRLSWQLLGVPKAQRHRVDISLDDWAGGIEEVAVSTLKELGVAKAVVPDHKLPYQSFMALLAYGSGLDILREQSLDPRARITLSRERLQSAYREFEKAADMAPTFDRAWVARAEVSAMLADAAKAEGEFVQAMAHGLPHSPATSIGAYYLYWRNGQFSAAIDELESCVGQHQGFLLGLGYLGEAYMRVNRPEDSLKTFQAYSRRVPNNPWVLANRSLALARIGAHDLAKRDADRLLEEFPEAVFSWANAFDRFMDAGQSARAQPLIATALIKFPSDPTLLARRSYLELEASQVQKAIDTATEATKRLSADRDEPLGGYAHMALGHALALAGKRAEAFEAFRTAQQLGVGAYERTIVLRDSRLKEIISDPSCPLRPEGLQGTK